MDVYFFWTKISTLLVASPGVPAPRGARPSAFFWLIMFMLSARNEVKPRDESSGLVLRMSTMSGPLFNLLLFA